MNNDPAFLVDLIKEKVGRWTIEFQGESAA